MVLDHLVDTFKADRIRTLLKYSAIKLKACLIMS